MTTRGEAKKTASTKKGIAKKRAKKLAQRKPTKTSRTMGRQAKPPRTKRDTTAVIAHEVNASAPKTRATQSERKARRVRGS